MGARKAAGLRSANANRECIQHCRCRRAWGRVRRRPLPPCSLPPVARRGAASTETRNQVHACVECSGEWSSVLLTHTFCIFLITATASALVLNDHICKSVAPSEFFHEILSLRVIKEIHLSEKLGKSPLRKGNALALQRRLRKVAVTFHTTHGTFLRRSRDIQWWRNIGGG